MKNKGKSICRVLKTIRQQVADANGISYKPCECHHKGDCLGTCPACEAEVTYLQQQLALRRQLGRAAVIVGVSASLLGTPACSQNPKAAPVVVQKDTTKRVLVGAIEQMPQFPGGGGALMKFIEQEMVYPPAAVEQRLQGRVIVSFTIARDGRITNVKTLKSVHPLLDDEALRIVSKMPRWLPGKQMGNAVDTKFTLPITFKLDKK